MKMINGSLLNYLLDFSVKYLEIDCGNKTYFSVDIITEFLSYSRTSIILPVVVLAMRLPPSSCFSLGSLYPHNQESL